MSEDKIFRVVNKVFETHFWTKEDAEKFQRSTPVSSGFRIDEVTIFGKRPDWFLPIDHDLGVCAEKHKKEMEELNRKATERLGW